VKHDAITVVFITSENGGRGLAAQVAINAIGIHIPRAWRILRQAAVFVGHITSLFLFGLISPRLAEAWDFVNCSFSFASLAASLIRRAWRFSFEGPQIIFAELRTTRAAAGVTFLAKPAIAKAVGAEPPANIARDAFIQGRRCLRFPSQLRFWFHIASSH
jgi:hypothetical protein